MSDADTLIHHWNDQVPPGGRTIKIIDETLRDGLQGGVPRVPTIDDKVETLLRAEKLGISEAVVGFPAHELALEEAVEIATKAHEAGVTIPLGFLGRMEEQDIRNIEEVRQKSGHPVVAWLFVGCSPIRRYAEDQDVERLVERTQFGSKFAKSLGLPVNYGTEDTTRSEPAVVERLMRVAVEEGVETCSICDTTGYLEPSGTRRIVSHLRSYFDDLGLQVRLDLHAHNDRGMGAANVLAAARNGIDVIHCTVMGIGERSGNTPLELSMVNLKMAGYWPGDITDLPGYCKSVLQSMGLGIHSHYPVLGDNAFLTQAGLHASAIRKAESRGDEAMAGQIYSAVDPKMIGLDYRVVVGPESGRSNVRFVLERAGMDANDNAIIDRILRKAREEKRMLTTQEVTDLAATLAAETRSA